MVDIIGFTILYIILFLVPMILLAIMDDMKNKDKFKDLNR